MGRISLKGSRILITGGAGFLGSNLAHRLLSQGCSVTVLDNFSRGPGCDFNRERLQSRPESSNLRILKGDVRDKEVLKGLVRDNEVIVHAAAQVSVPLSVKDPLTDFETNVVGTYNLLEACRNSNLDSVVLNVGSNKVYGAPEVELVESESRYEFAPPHNGVDETYPIRPLEPYGASKASSEIYMNVYNVRFGLKTTTLRFSLLYGPRQWGTEEQGFVGWFCVAAALGLPVTIYGNGKQVRDILYVTDALEAMEVAIENIRSSSGTSINIGGTRTNSVSLVELLDFLETTTGRRIQRRFQEWRENDVRCFWTDCRKAREVLGWSPAVGWQEGVKRSYEFAIDNQDFLRTAYRFS